MNQPHAYILQEASRTGDVLNLPRSLDNIIDSCKEQVNVAQIGGWQERSTTNREGSMRVCCACREKIASVFPPESRSPVTRQLPLVSELMNSFTRSACLENVASSRCPWLLHIISVPQNISRCICAIVEARIFVFVVQRGITQANLCVLKAPFALSEI